jgi:UPF0755 protein
MSDKNGHGKHGHGHHGHAHGHGGDDHHRPMHPRSPRQAIQPERMPPPPSKRAKHPLVVAGNAILTILMFLMLGAGAAVYIGKQKTEEAGPLDRERAVVIPRGGVRDMAALLKREGVIEQPLLFVAATVLTGSTGELKAGEYLFEKGASIRDVIDTIISGKVVQHQITIAEGLTSEQIVARLMENDVLTGEVKQIPREGTMLPESYRITRGTTREQMVQRMQAAHTRIMNEIWERRSTDSPIRTREQFVTMASIVEKETGKADERTRVAGVFINRLNRKMRLQSDPTIIYGLVGGKGSLGRPILREEIDRPTPYNTYTIEGLPPGPIANPGRASLEAVANPSRTKELYFVADGTGGHVFAETYDQHLRNVRQWREYQKEQATATRELQQAPQPDAASAPGPGFFVSPGNSAPAQQAAPEKKGAAEKAAEKKAAQEKKTTERAEKKAAAEKQEKKAAETEKAEKKAAPEKKSAEKKAAQKKGNDETPSIMSEPLPSADVEAPRQRQPLRQ